MRQEKNARRMWKSGRADDRMVGRIIPQAGRDLKRDDPEGWARGWNAVAWLFAAWAAAMVLMEAVAP